MSCLDMEVRCAESTSKIAKTERDITEIIELGILFTIEMVESVGHKFQLHST
jgi:hypothetical protein